MLLLKKQLITGLYFHFVTFSCKGRRNLLSTPFARNIVISILSKISVKNKVRVCGFVIMPNHVHAIIGFDDDRDLPKFMQSWKRLSAHYLKKYYEKKYPDILSYLKSSHGGKKIINFWERRYYDFNIESEEKLLEKLNYMHENPVKAQLANNQQEYIWSSAAWYLQGRSVGVRIGPGI
jgi:putative transposase